MPLVKRGKPDEASPPPVESTDALVGELRHPDPERRWSAARAPRREGERGASVSPAALGGCGTAQWRDRGIGDDAGRARRAPRGAAARPRLRRSHLRGRADAQGAGAIRGRVAVPAARSRDASERLRGGGRRAGRDRLARRDSASRALPRAVRRPALPSVCDRARDRNSFPGCALTPLMNRWDPRRDLLVVTDDEGRRLCDFFYRQTGMMFAQDKRYYTDRRLAERMAATASPSL